MIKILALLSSAAGSWEKAVPSFVTERRTAVADTAKTLEDMDLPGFRLHPLKGDKQGVWAIDVSKNWRITFEFIDGNAYIVNYEDYH